MVEPIEASLLRQLGHVFDPPRPGYHATLEALADALVPVRLDAARMVRGFANRVADLSGPELEELHNQTFNRPSMAGERPADIVKRLSYVDAEVQPDFVARVAVPALGRMLEVLEPERNPFALLVKATFCLLLPLVSGPASPTG